MPVLNIEQSEEDIIVSALLHCILCSLQGVDFSLHVVVWEFEISEAILYLREWLSYRMHGYVCNVKKIN